MIKLFIVPLHTILNLHTWVLGFSNFTIHLCTLDPDGFFLPLLWCKHAPCCVKWKYERRNDEGLEMNHNFDGFTLIARRLNDSQKRLVMFVRVPGQSGALNAFVNKLRLTL